MRKQACVDVDLETLLPELQSPDEGVRARAAGSLCPCRVGWKLFEQHLHLLSRLMKDKSPAVRAHALHVFEDAARMQNLEEAEYRFQSVEERLQRKRGPRFQGEVVEPEIRRSGIFKKRRGRFVRR